MNAPTSKKGTFVIPLIVGILVAGALVYYFLPKFQQESSEIPPNITISSSKFQGLLVSGEDVCKISGTYAFSDNQVSTYIKPGPDNDTNWHTLEKGGHIYHFGTDLTMQEVINRIIPTAGNKIMIAYYPANTENAEKKFVVYPAMAGQTPVVELKDSIIPANHGFVIFSCQDTKIWGVKTEKMGADKLTEVLNSKDAGWILIPAVFEGSGSAFENGFIKIHKDKIKSVWFQQGAGFDFKKIENLDNPQLVGDWKMIWLKIGLVDAPAAITVTQKTGLNKQVLIEWTDSAPQNTYKYLIYRSTTSPVDITSANMGQFVDFTPPGNLVGNPKKTDGTETFVDAMLLADNTKYYYIIKSIDSQDKTIVTSEEFSTTTLSAAAVAEIAKDMEEVGKAMDAAAAAAAEMNAAMDAAMKDAAAAAAAISQTITVTKQEGGNKQVTIKWTDSNLENDVYSIYRSKDTSNGQFLDPISVVYLVGVVTNIVTFTDKFKLEDNTKYYYIIKSIDSQSKVIGTSKEFSVTTVPAKAACGSATNPCPWPK